MEVIQSAGGILCGFGLTQFLSNPKYTLNKKLPNINLHIIEFFPRLKIKLKNSVLHIHHWILLSVALIVLFWTTTSFSQLLFFKSLCVGGIVQGFTFRDRFKIFY